METNQCNATNVGKRLVLENAGEELLERGGTFQCGELSCELLQVPVVPWRVKRKQRLPLDVF